MNGFMKKWLGLTALALAAQLAVQAQAADYPTRPVKLISPYAPGGSVEVFGRQVALRLAQRLGQPVIVETKPGAGGALGTEFVMRSAPDGYTILFHSGAIVTDAVLKKSTRYDVRTDLEPVIMAGNTALAIVVPNSLPVTTLAGFIDYAKKNPGKVNYGTPGIGSSVHLSTEMFKNMAGVDLMHVPYKGGGPAATAVMAGEVQVLFSTVVTAKPQVKGGRIKVLAVTTRERTASWPEVPTVAESGVPGYDYGAWYGMFVPAKTPKDVIARLNKEIHAVLQEPGMRSWMFDNGMDPVGNTPEEFRAIINNEVDRWAELQKSVQIKVE